MALDKETIIGMIQPLIDECEDYQDDLGDIRSNLYDRYRAEPYGNETLGWSSSVDPVIWDCLEGMLPTLVGIFNDDWFTLKGPSAERTSSFKELINYQLYRKQDGYQEIIAFLKDTLLYHYGVAKITYTEKYHEESETFDSLSAAEMADAAGYENVMITKFDEISEPDPITGGELKSYENIKMIKRTPEYKGPLFECIPPWEFGFTPGAPRLEDCALVYHKARRTLSYIKGKEEAGDYDKGSYQLARDQYAEPFSDEEEEYMDTQTDADSSLADDSGANYTAPELIPAIEVDIYECYVKLDIDDDGLLEDMIVTICGSVVLSMEENPYRRPPFRLGIAYPEGHKIPGIPLSSILEEDQKVMTNLKRMTQDAAAQSVYTNPITDDATLYKLLLERKPHDPLLGNPQRLGKLEVDPPSEFVLKAIEMIQGDIENKSGVTRYNQGTEGDSLNKTATGIKTIATMAQQRLKLVARNIGNTAMKGIIRDFIFINQKWPPVEAIRVLQNELPITDDDLAGEYDISIDVGIGPQEKQMVAQSLDQLLQFQLQAGLKLKLAGPEEIYKTIMRKYDYLDIDVSELVINPKQQVQNGNGQMAGSIGPGQPGQPAPQGQGTPQMPPRNG